MRRYFLLACLAFSGLLPLSICADDSRPKSGISEIDSLPLNDWKVETPPLSIAKTVTLSALIPGGGQFYSGHPVRGGFLLGMESLLFGLSLYSYFVDLPNLDRETNRLLDSADASLGKIKTDPNQQANFQGWVQLARANAAQRLQHADLANSEFAWAVGLHFYGMADAFEIANQSHPKDFQPRSAQRAMWCGLAFPGGGQLYNGRYGKFGLLWMALGASTVSGWSRQNVVESLNRSIAITRAEGLSTTTLEIDRTLYRKRRNQYYWGMGLLYVYAILDGMVDAALADFDQPNRYALLPGSTPLSMNLAVRF